MFDINFNGKIILNADWLNIPQFKIIYDTYNNKDQDYMIILFSIIYYVADIRSPYRQSFNSDELLKGVIKELYSKGLPKKDATLVNKAIAAYTKLTETKLIKLYKASEKALESLIAYFESFDYASIDPDKVDDVVDKMMKNLKAVNPLAKSLAEGYKNVKKDLEEGSIRGGGKIRAREQAKSKR